MPGSRSTKQARGTKCIVPVSLQYMSLVCGFVDVHVVELAARAHERQRVDFRAGEAALFREVLVAVAAVVGRVVVSADVAAQLGDVLQVVDLDVVEIHVEHVVDAQAEHALGHVPHDVAVADHARSAH